MTKYEEALDAINILCEDEDLSKEETKSALEELQQEIESMIDSL